MYLCVAWQAFTEDADVLREIRHSVDLALGSLPRAQLLSQVVLVRPKLLNDVSDLIANLDSIEIDRGPVFGYTLLLHSDGDRFRCSDPFDVAGARAVAKADPI